MSQLEDLKPSAAVRGILPDSLVTVVNVQWFGSTGLELTYKDADGRVANRLLYRHDEPGIEVVEQGRPWSRPPDQGADRPGRLETLSGGVSGQAQDLSRHFRDEVVRRAEVQYAA